MKEAAEQPCAQPPEPELPANCGLRRYPTQHTAASPTHSSKKQRHRTLHGCQNPFDPGKADTKHYGKYEGYFIELSAGRAGLTRKQYLR